MQTLSALTFLPKFPYQASAPTASISLLQGFIYGGGGGGLRKLSNIIAICELALPPSKFFLNTTLYQSKQLMAGTYTIRC